MSTTIRGLRVNYHAADKAPLTQDVLVPLVRHAQQTPGVESAWLQTHWHHGPHSTLYLHGEAGTLEALLPDLQRRVLEHLSTHPSTEPVDEQQWERLSEDLGRLELISPPYLPIQADNTVSVREGHPADTFLRTTRAIEHKGALLSAGLDPLADQDGRLHSGTAAHAAAFRGMAAVAVSYPRWGLISGYQAFLSHWKEYFHWHDDQGRLSTPLARAWQAQGQDLVQVVELARSRQPGQQTGDAVLDRWFTWIDSGMPQALDLADTGDILPYPHSSRLEQAETFGHQTAVQWSGSDEREYSDFHQAFRQLDFTKLGNGSDFAAYRFLINTFFDLLPLMGITPIQRYSLAYLFTEAAQVAIGETWDQTVAKAVAQQRQEDPQVRPTLPWAGSHV